MSSEEQDPLLEGGVDLAERDETAPKKPRNFRVLLHNDDYTPAEFVVELLEILFHKPHGDALDITMEIHEKGSAVAGIYSYEIAETKAAQTIMLARQREYPLVSSIEPDE